MDYEEKNQELLQLIEEMKSKLEETEFRLEEANDTIDAIRSGDIDALIVKDDSGHQVFTLKTADQTFRIFIEQMSEGAITIHQNGNILYANSQFASILSMPLQKIIGQKFSKFIDPADRKHWDDLLFKAWLKDSKGEVILLTSEDTYVPVILSLKTLDLDEGISMSVIITDLSLQKETQRLLQLKNSQLEDAQRIAIDLNESLENTVKKRTKALQKNIEEKSKIADKLKNNQERLTQILETMAEGVVILDLEGNLNYANPMAQKILGITVVPGKRNSYNDPEWPVLRVDGETLPLEEYPIRTAMLSEQPLYDFEIAIQPPVGERFYISINAAPIKGKKGKVVAGIGTFMDVTHRRKATQQKDDFISVASHELRTPVTTLKASLQLLDRMKNQVDSPMVPKLIVQANKSMNKMSVLIEDLLNATKMNAGHLQLNLSPISIAELINTCYEHVLINDDFTILTKGDLSLEVNADANKIDQVLINFVSNVIKYAPGSKEITVSVEEIDGTARISIIDNGPGIPPEKVPHLFERYYRAETEGAQYSGLGLGLYICAQIIEKHGGRIGAESELGKGSCFWFTLPLSIKTI